MKTGHAVVAGRPNVGKSTLFNRLVGPRLSIVTRRRQTTRYCIRGIVTDDKMQLVLLDTPGWQIRDRNPLNSLLNKSVRGVMPVADVGLLVVEATGIRDDDQRIAGFFPEDIPMVAAINKSDLVQRQKMLPVAEALSQWRPFEAIVPLSARTGEGVDVLAAELRKLLPEAEKLYPDDMVSDRDESFFIAEFIREQIFRHMSAELPYTAAAEVLAIERDKKGLVRITADIIVDTESRKAMFIGAKGQNLKKIGTAARRNLEKHLKEKVYLELFVKTRRNWSREPGQLARIGLDRAAS